MPAPVFAHAWNRVTISGGEHLPQVPWTEPDLAALAGHSGPSNCQDAANLLDELAHEPGAVFTLEELAACLGRSGAGVAGTLSELSQYSYVLTGRFALLIVFGPRCGRRTGWRSSRSAGRAQGAADVQGPFVALGPPGGQHRLDQLPPFAGEVARPGPLTSNSAGVTAGCHTRPP